MFKINHLISNEKILEKEQRIILKEHRKKEVIKLNKAINNLGNKHMIEESTNPRAFSKRLITLTNWRG